MTGKPMFNVHDIVRVRRANGTFSETCYVITELDGFACKIGEYADGRVYKPEPFDVSLIERVDRIPDSKIC